MPSKKYIVSLTDSERAELHAMVKKGKADANKIKHAHILLKADSGAEAWEDEKIATTFGCHRRTIENIRQRFVIEGTDAALNRKKRVTPPRENILDGEKEAKLIAVACGEKPDGRSSWSLRLLADKIVELEIVDRISHETVRKTLKKTSLNRTCESAG